MANGSQHNYVKTFKGIYYTALVIGAIITLRILFLQYLSNDILRSDDIYKKEKIPATRGSILSHDGRPLAISVPSYEIRWDSKVVNDSIFKADINALSRALANYFKDKTAKQYKDSLTKAKNNNRRYYLVTRKRIDQTEVEYIKSLPIFSLGAYKGGLRLEDKTKRTYPFGNLGYRTVGYISEGMSGTGIEISHNHKLEGKSGEQTIYFTTGGNWIPANGEPYIPAENGYDIRTTLDVYIQEAAESELRKQLELSPDFNGGTAIVMDVKTGAVRASANLFKKANGTFDETYNYAIGHPTEPGSTLKLAALVALLEDDYYDLNDSIDTGNGVWSYAGYDIKDTRKGGYGKLSVQQAFEKSSNIAFAKMVVNAYEKHPEDYVERLHNMKLVEKLNLDIRGEGYASITTPDDKTFWSKSSLPSLGYGYALTLTPLHTLTFYNAIANGGKMMRPYFIESYERDGIVYEKFDPVVVSGSICSKETVREATQALRGVVENGTGRKLNDPRYKIAAKTGTARISFDGGYEDKEGYKMHQASIAGFFPADDPKYSCIVVLYTKKIKKDYYGGDWAGPIFKNLADKIYALNPQWNEPLERGSQNAPDNPVIAPGRAFDLSTVLDYVPIHDNLNIKKGGWVCIGQSDGNISCNDIEIDDHTMPSVLGMGLKDALYFLENQGYKVTFKGSGKVYSQSPAPGEECDGAGVVRLVLK